MKYAHNKHKTLVGGHFTHKHWRVITVGIYTTLFVTGASIWGVHSLAVHNAEFSRLSLNEQEELLAPSVQNALKSFATPVYASTESAIPTKPVFVPKDISIWIDEAVQEFLPTHYSESLMIMHCLAHRENGHAGNLGARGDNGLAIGAFQFHESTWISYRKLMIKDNLATEIGDPLDVHEAVRTTAWAISTGRALAWGPELRYSHGSDFAVCQTPSWYK